MKDWSKAQRVIKDEKGLPIGFEPLNKQVMSKTETKEMEGEMHLRHKLELGREIDHLRSELQKAKELNGELVKGLGHAIIELEIYTKNNAWIPVLQHLIKKSES